MFPFPCGGVTESPIEFLLQLGEVLSRDRNQTALLQSGLASLHGGGVLRGCGNAGTAGRRLNRRWCGYGARFFRAEQLGFEFCDQPTEDTGGRFGPGGVGPAIEDRVENGRKKVVSVDNLGGPCVCKAYEKYSVDSSDGLSGHRGTFCE